ncbi:MAG: galactose-1-phosphate uridylyltransferase [Armatimonadota bacterium]
MSELRWHPVLEQWVITATHRQDRTFLPPDDYCPLCPTKKGSFPTEIPSEDYEIVVFENRFPSLSHPAPRPAVEETDLYKIKPADGICEVVVYTPNHNGTLADSSITQIRNLIEVWADRYEELGGRDFIDYVLIFENKGKEIGVTLTHPHGQIYAFPFIPPFIQQELNSSKAYHQKNGKCLYCNIIEEEKKDGRRIVAENDLFVAFIPFFARFPYEVYILPKNHKSDMSSLDDKERDHLANILKVVLTKYDNLWGFSLPYMMIMHQAPTDSRDHSYFHYNIQFHPPYRTANKLKYLAGCESGAGNFINDTLAEEKAEELRNAEPSTAKDTKIYL